MKKKFPNFYVYFKPGLFLLFFLFFAFDGFGQSISKPILSENTYCSNSSITFNFDLSSGAGRGNRYENDSEFSIKIISQNSSNITSIPIDMGTVPGNKSSLQKQLTVDITDFDIGAGEYKLSIHSVDPISDSPESNTFTIENPVTYTETELGNDSWIGHVYDGTNQNRAFNQTFSNYIGGYTEALSFDRNFGGNTNNFQLGTGTCAPSVYTETFSVRYKMNSTSKGLYSLNIGSDDGTRLNVDGELVYNDWNNHSYRNQNILIRLSGTSNLILDYYENSGGNRVSVGTPQRVIENVLTTNTDQIVDFQNEPQSISGDEFANLPNGITKNGTGYQWVYSNTEGGTTTNINGATAASFTPDENSAPFNEPGTYYIYRIASLRGNNTGQNYTTSIKSNSAVVTIEEPCTETPTVVLSAPSTVCSGQINITGTLTGTAPWNLQVSLNNQNFNISVNEANFDYPIQLQETTSINVLNIIDGKGCTNNAPEESITINVINSVTNNTISGSQESCGILDPEELIGEDLGIGYSYIWELSTTSATSGFSSASGINNEVNYDPGTLAQTTWYRRRVEVQNCTENISNPVEIAINSEIENNTISFFNGNSGKLQATANENEQINLAAPEGTAFTYVNFASYGTPVDTSGNFSINENCHATTSQSVTESYLLGENTATIPATNTVFTDPCVGTLKRLYITATYAEAFCKGSNPGIVTGSAISENNISYTWELSTEGPASGFAPAPGTSNQQDYDLGILNEDIWLKRTVNAGSCSSESPVLYIPVVAENVWTGAENNNWNNLNNWSCNTLPTLETNVLIPEILVSGNYPEITTGNNAFAKNLTIENDASVSVQENWLRIAGNLTNNGILNTETGSVSFEGTASQIIPTAAFENNRIKNLRINNSSGVTSEAIIKVTGNLDVENGNFDTGNELTLISNEIQTALIDGSGNGEVVGLVSMQRYLDKAFGYKYFSSPFQNSIVEDFSPYMSFEDPVTTFPHFYRYDENRNIAINNIVRDATGWTVYTNPGNNLNLAEGYALNFGTSTEAQTIELIGEVNNGLIPARQLENNHREYTRGFHLVGNPYPSPIDWNATQGWTKNNIDNAIYFFTASDINQYTGTYTAYVNDISTEDPTVDGRSSNIIPSMQGFFIKVSDSDTQDLVTGIFGMDNRVRKIDFEQEFLRNQSPDEKSLLRFEAGFEGASKKDLMVIYFSSFATPDFEKEMDAHKLMNTDPAVPSFYNITTDQKELAINAIPFPESQSYKKIPLGLKADESGKMKINLASIENLSSNFNIYLIDHVQSIGQNLAEKPEYVFDIKAGTHNTRFELMFSEEKITNSAIAFDEPFSVRTRAGDIVVQLNLKEGEEGILRVSSMTGQILQVKEGTGKEEVVFNGITSDGVYIINLQLGKEYYAKKVVIKK